MVIEDDEKVFSKMDGKRWLASSFAYKLRIALFKEHLGLDEYELKDPVSDQFWERLNSIAKVMLILYALT